MNYSKTLLKSYPKNPQIKNRILLEPRKLRHKTMKHNKDGVAECFDGVYCL